MANGPFGRVPNLSDHSQVPTNPNVLVSALADCPLEFVASGDTRHRGFPYRIRSGYISVTVGRSRVNGFATDPVTMAYHELRSPLALMATMARSAAEDCASEELRSRCLSIVRTAERMLRTASQVMEVAETASDDCLYKFAPVDVVSKVVDDYRGMDVAVELEAPVDRYLEVLAAPGQLEALLCSIIGNALDHGSLRSPILVSVSEIQHAVVIQVRNAVGRTRSHRGLGLGSYIGDQLARALNSSLEVVRTDAEFSARITIPAAVRELAFAI
jgi:two-component system, chemotaxis family, sensor kinase Cph1